MEPSKEVVLTALGTLMHVEWYVKKNMEECTLEYSFGHCQGIMPSASHSSVRALMHGPKPLATPSLLPFLDPLAPRRLRNAPAYCAVHGWDDWAWGNTLALRRHQRRPDAFSR